MRRQPLPNLQPLLEDFFRSRASVTAEDRVIVAFSGGPDSTALLLEMNQLAHSGRGPAIVAAHVDHGLDPASGSRAEAAAEFCRKRAIPYEVLRALPGEEPRPKGGLEATARHLRYGLLEEMRRRFSASLIVTGHHREDQVETILLRLLHGSGLEGLGAMSALRGFVARPFLNLSRQTLQTTVDRHGAQATMDPTNQDLSLARNALRHRTLPLLTRREPNLEPRLLNLAAGIRRAYKTLGARLATQLDLRRESALGIGSRETGIGEAPAELASFAKGASVKLSSFRHLPAPLWPAALALLQRAAGQPYPPPATAHRELARQLASGRRVGCDCGGGWRLRTVKDRLVLSQPAAQIPFFSYTFVVPGAVEIPQLSLRFQLRLAPSSNGDPKNEEMGCRWSCRLVLPLEPGASVTVRNRLRGDRFRPVGSASTHRLKEILIDHKVPRHQRDRLPLLCVGEEILWIPGVTLAAPAAASENRPTVWLAEIIDS